MDEQESISEPPESTCARWACWTSLIPGAGVLLFILLSFISLLQIGKGQTGFWLLRRGVFGCLLSNTVFFAVYFAGYSGYESAISDSLYFFLPRHGAYITRTVENRIEANYRFGKLQGPFKTWSYSDVRYEEVNYRNNSREGQYVLIVNNIKREDGLYKNNRRNGLWTTYDKSGHKTQTTEYSNDQLNGMQTLYDQNGKLATETTYQNGIRRGIARIYSDGQLVEESFYLDNMRNGPYRSWRDGQRTQEGEYDQNQKNGKWTNWNSKGEIESVLYYRYNRTYRRVFYKNNRPAREESDLDNGGSLETVYDAAANPVKTTETRKGVVRTRLFDASGQLREELITDKIFCNTKISFDKSGKATRIIITEYKGKRLFEDFDVRAKNVIINKDTALLSISIKKTDSSGNIEEETTIDAHGTFHTYSYDKSGHTVKETIGYCGDGSSLTWGDINDEDSSDYNVEYDSEDVYTAEGRESIGEYYRFLYENKLSKANTTRQQPVLRTTIISSLNAAGHMIEKILEERYSDGSKTTRTYKYDGSGKRREIASDIKRSDGSSETITRFPLPSYFEEHKPKPDGGKIVSKINYTTKDVNIIWIDKNGLPYKSFRKINGHSVSHHVDTMRSITFFDENGEINFRYILNSRRNPVMIYTYEDGSLATLWQTVDNGSTSTYFEQNGQPHSVFQYDKDGYLQAVLSYENGVLALRWEKKDYGSLTIFFDPSGTEKSRETRNHEGDLISTTPSASANAH